MISNNTKVSVLIPLYNSEKYISDTVRSVLAQTYPNIEIVIVDDGSTDNSYSVAKQFESDRVHVYTQPNSGPGKTRNAAFEVSTGNYIQYLDADDLLEPDKIALQMKQIQNHSDKTLFIGDIEEFSTTTSLRKKHTHPYFKNYKNPTDFLIDFWNFGGMLQIGSLLIPRQLILESGPWNERWILNEDGEFLCRLVANCSEIIHEPKAMCHYRRDNIFSLNNTRTPKHYQSQFESYETYLTIANSHPDNIALKEALFRQYSRFIQNIYLNFPELIPDVLSRIHALGYNNPMPVGNKKFRLLTYIIGIKNSVILRNFVRNFRHSLISKMRKP